MTSPNPYTDASTACTGKVAFASFKLARDVTQRRGRIEDGREAYHCVHCVHCQKWHVGSIRKDLRNGKLAAAKRAKSEGFSR